MLDADIFDTLVSSGAFFSINEKNMTVTAGIEDRLYVDGVDDFHGFNVFMKTIDFPLGENLFNFLAISFNDFETIRILVENNKYWNGNHPTGNVSDFLLSLDCAYLYLLYYSFERSALHFIHRPALAAIAKEFEFVLNFCCNDSFNESLKPLTAMQRYYIYCQLYEDNTLTRDRAYIAENYLFLEPEEPIDSLNKIERVKKKRINLDDYLGYEPITIVPDLKDVTDKLKNISVSASYRYQHNRIEQYLLKELFALIKLDIRVKKCKNCGKYFIIKGDYATDYCDRIPDGEKFTCKKIAAMRARKKKVQNNPILKEYEKAYKRMYARLSNHKLSNEDFRLWVEDASRKRDSAAAEYSSGPSGDIINQFKEYLGNK